MKFINQKRMLSVEFFNPKQSVSIRFGGDRSVVWFADSNIFYVIAKQNLAQRMHLPKMAAGSRSGRELTLTRLASLPVTNMLQNPAGNRRPGNFVGSRSLVTSKVVSGCPGCSSVLAGIGHKHFGLAES
jgi:hypothetical protein